MPVAAALLAYLAHSDGTSGRGESASGDIDRILSSLLRSVTLSELLDWRLGPFLSGTWGGGVVCGCDVGGGGM